MPKDRLTEKMNIPKLAIFDMDGLIFDSERLFMNMKHTILKEYGYPAREEDYLQTIGLAGQQLHDKLSELYGQQYPAEEISRKTRAKVNGYMESHGPDVKPGVECLLAWFRKHQIPCCVASSTRREYVEKYLKLAHLDHYFSYTIGGDEAARSKPEPDIFLAACERSRTSPSDALVLEDSENGIRAAFAAGIPAVCIPDLKQPSPEIANMAAAVLKSADKLIPFFGSPQK